MSDPIPRKQCACGWKRPLFAITRADGHPPTEALHVAYDCPECGRVHLAGDVTSSAQASTRARAIAEEATKLLLRKLS